METEVVLKLKREPVRFKTQNFATFSCSECSMVIDTDLIDDAKEIDIRITQTNGQQNTN